MKTGLSILEGIMVYGATAVGVLMMCFLPDSGGGVFPPGFALIGFGISVASSGMFAVLDTERRGWLAGGAILGGLLLIATPFIILVT